jgi:hypothetical protein
LARHVQQQHRARGGAFLPAIATLVVLTALLAETARALAATAGYK